MRTHRVLSLAFAAFVVSAVASCAGDGGSPTGSDTSASPGNEAHPNGTQLVLASGGSQTGLAGQPLPNPVVVRVLDTSSKPVPGATVNFIAKDGSADPAQASTDADGQARTTWTLGSAAGSQELRVAGTGGTTLVVSAVAVAPAKVARVQVIPDSMVLVSGATGDFSAVAYDSAGNALTGRTIAWTTTDSVVATVGATGTVTAVSPGSARVVATVEGVSGSAGVRVVPPPPARVARVEVAPDSIVLVPGRSGDFNAAAYDAAGNLLTGRAIAWTISDSTVAAIATGGTVTGVAPGTAHVTATVEGVSGSATVIVVAPPPAAVARVAVTPDSVVLQPGQTGDFDATAYDAGGHVLTGRAVAWTSSDSAVARVGDQGGVTAVAPGTARITATVDGIDGFAEVIVVAPPPAAVARVVVSPDSVVLIPGQEADLNAAAYDAEGHVLTGRAVTWTTSESTVARLGAGGRVIGGLAGSARITATVEGVSGSAMVFVNRPYPEIVRVEIVPDSLAIEVGQTGDFSAFAYDATNHIISGVAVRWSASDSTVVQLNLYGGVRALKAGTARITATVDGVSGWAGVRVFEHPVGNATAPPNASPDIGAGYEYVCRLRSGIIQCFGSDAMGQPIGEHRPAAGSFVQLSAGQTHACGLRSDGVVECFGSNDYGEAPAQKRASTGSFTQVSAGLSHTCAIRTDGAMECWGANGHGEAPPVVTPQAGKFVVVTAFANRTCDLRNDGAVECRGFRHGSPDVTVLPGGWYVKMGTAVGITVCFERNSGLGECWGPANLGSGPYEELTAGAGQECVLRPGGTAFCTGNASNFEGPGERSLTGPDEGSIRLRTWARITAGSYHTCGLRADGYFECFGLQTIGSDAPDVVPSADPPRSALSGASVRLSWRDINSNELRTEIDRSVADGNGEPTTWARAGVLSANQTGFTDAQAAPGGIYVYRIRVCNNAGCSGWAQSNSTRFPAAAPPVPTGVAASGYVCGYTSCGKVTWTADITFVDSFRVQRRAMAGAAYGEWADVWTRVSRDHTQFDDWGLTPGTTYQYRVAACNVSACSGYGTSNSFVASSVPPPAAPADLTAGMENSYMMHIVWGDVATETGYELQRREYDGAAWGAWSEPVGRAMNDTHDEQYVVLGTLYQWRIRACNQGGCSAYTSSDPTRASW
ncbi:MAG: Ig-like domain-containing protein [Longimicrobiaceae bacterium]